MSNKELHIFKENTDAIATNRGFHYQYLKTMKLWINNFICDNDIDIYCEWEDDIGEHDQNTQKYTFHQVKSYSDKLGINDEHFISSILNFYNLNRQYDVDEFYFITNSDFKPIAGKELRKWYENRQKGIYEIPDNIILIIKNNLITYATKRLEKGLDTIKDKKSKEHKTKEIKSKLFTFKDDLEKDDFIEFLKKIRFDISQVSDPKEDIENLEHEIAELLKSEKLIYDRTTNLEQLFCSIYFDVSKKSSNSEKTSRLLNRNVLDRLLKLIHIEKVLDFYTNKELLIELNKILELCPNHTIEIYEAEKCIQNQEFPEALIKYKKILEVENQNDQTEALEYKISAIYVQLNEYQEAIEICKKYNNTTKFLMIYGICLGKLHKYEEAISVFMKINTHELDDKILYNIAVSYMFLHDLENAINYFNLSIEKNDHFENSYLNLAICQYILNPLNNDVLRNLDKALALDKNMEQALSQKGEVERFLGKYAKAKQLFKEALKLNPINTTALYGLAMCFFENGKYEDGLIHFNNWFYNLYQKHINNEVIIIDIGNKKTISFTVKAIGNILELSIDNKKFILQSNIGNDYMFIGANEENYIIGKKYLKFNDYLNTKTQIIEILNLTQNIIDIENILMNHIPTPIFETIDPDQKLKIYIDENEGYIKIVIAEMTIEGFIERLEGFYNFIDYYNNIPFCSIILENAENDQNFIIDTFNRCEIIG
ncbi:MAG: CDC27 family protein [Pseudomonadota bacterium]